MNLKGDSMLTYLNKQVDNRFEGNKNHIDITTKIFASMFSRFCKKYVYYNH